MHIVMYINLLLTEFFCCSGVKLFDYLLVRNRSFSNTSTEMNNSTFGSDKKYV